MPSNFFFQSGILNRPIKPADSLGKTVMPNPPDSRICLWASLLFRMAAATRGGSWEHWVTQEAIIPLGPSADETVTR